MSGDNQKFLFKLRVCSPLLNFGTALLSIGEQNIMID